MQEETGEALQDTGIGNDILDRPLSTTDKSNSRQFRLYPTRSLCIAKEIISRGKNLPIEWEKIFANYFSDKGLIFRVYQELKELNNNQQSN